MTTTAPRRLRLPILPVAALALLVLAVGSLAPAIGTALAQRQQIAETRADIAADRARAADLDQRIAAWDDPAYVRAEAGSRLLFVVPGETTYRVVGAAPAAAAAAARPGATGGWAQRLLTSVVVAGQR